MTLPAPDIFTGEVSAYETILAVDFDANAAATYAANFPGVEVRCSRVEDELCRLPDADIIIGGPPCQSFSLAGKGLGEYDPRNGWPAAMEAVAWKQPRMFLFENVAGMLTAKHIKYLAKIYGAFEGIGYVLQWRKLDAVEYGVPQFRDRIWIWGIRADLHAAGMRHQWPAPTHCWPPQADGLFGEHALLPGVTVGQALHIWYPGCGWALNVPSPTLEGGSSKSHTNGLSVVNDQAWRKSFGGEKTHAYRWSAAMLAKHPPASPASPASPVMAKFYKGGAEGLLAMPKVIAAPSPTISTGGTDTGGAEPILHMKRELFCRRLTTAECMRLMSAPDSFVWPEKISKTAKYKIAGNGQASGMTAHLAAAFRRVDQESKTVIDLFCGGGLGACGWAGKYWTYTPSTPKGSE